MQMLLRTVVSALVAIALLLTLSVNVAALAAPPARPSTASVPIQAADRSPVGHVLARKFVRAGAATTVRARGGYAIRVPSGRMLAAGWVTISSVRRGVVDFHISAPWRGSVAITMPVARRANNQVLHQVGGLWLAEGTAPGLRTVWVTQLSWFTTLITKGIDKVKGAVCFVASISAFIECLVKKGITVVNKELAKWIIARLPGGCAAHMIEAGLLTDDPVAPFIAALTDSACVGKAGETYTVPPSPQTNGPATGGNVSTPSGSYTPPSHTSAPVPSGSYTETVGGVAHTWTDYTNAGGTQGPSIQAYESVGIACRLTGFRVADGNTWWYQIASSPWNGAYYVSADAFYNNGATSGSLAGTPFVDTAVPLCGSSGGGGGGGGGGGSPTYAETVGGVTHTWTNYTNAGGTQGPSIQTGQTVQIACKVTGFRVADGNTWWYRIASSPWNNAYYASADAFYNNGATSGSLSGTPFVDNAVPNC